MSRINDYDMLGVFLLNDKDGSIVERIKQDKKVTNKIVFEIFRRWLRGEGQKNGPTTPIRTWDRLVYYLRQTENIVLAEDIELILQACTEEKHKCSRRDKEQIYQDKAAECFQEFESPTCNLHILITSVVTVLICIISGIVIILLYHYHSGKRDRGWMVMMLGVDSESQSDSECGRYAVSNRNDYHVIVIRHACKEKKYVGEGADFNGHVPRVGNPKLKFLCKVSMEGNSSHYELPWS